jgi:fructokinase
LPGLLRYGSGVPADAPVSFVVVGEALIDLIPADNDAYLARPGGSPLNVAVGLARLGQPAALAGRLSADPFGTVLRQRLERSGVDLRHLLAAPEPSTIALVDLSGGHARYEFSAGGADFQWTPAELEFLPAGARAVHFGSLASWLPPGDAAITGTVRRIRAGESVLVSYDPNVRPALQPDPAAARQQVERSVALAHVVKASAEDVAWLYGSADPAEIAGRWLGLGAGLVVVTSGADGATGWTRSGLTVTRPARRHGRRRRRLHQRPAGRARPLGRAESGDGERRTRGPGTRRDPGQRRPGGRPDLRPVRCQSAVAGGD